jgi:hypothetical protein
MGRSYTSITKEEFNELKTLLEEAKDDKIEFLGETLSIEYANLLLIACADFYEKDQSSNT